MMFYFLYLINSCKIQSTYIHIWSCSLGLLPSHDLLVFLSIVKDVVLWGLSDSLLTISYVYYFWSLVRGHLEYVTVHCWICQGSDNSIKDFLKKLFLLIVFWFPVYRLDIRQQLHLSILNQTYCDSPARPQHNSVFGRMYFYVIGIFN